MLRSHCITGHAPPPALATGLGVRRAPLTGPSRLERLAEDLGVRADDLRRHLHREIDRRRLLRLPMPAPIVATDEVVAQAVAA
jgi:hypothetical protein